MKKGEKERKETGRKEEGGKQTGKGEVRGREGKSNQTDMQSQLKSRHIIVFIKSLKRIRKSPCLQELPVCLSK